MHRRPWTTANEVKGNYDALVSDADNPAVDLVDELAKTGGDDGQALVSAITGNYDATQDNEDRLDALLTTELRTARSPAGSSTSRISSVKAVTWNSFRPISICWLERAERMRRSRAMPMTSRDSTLGSVTTRETSDRSRPISTARRRVSMPTYVLRGDGLIGKADCALARSAHNEGAITDIEGEIDDIDDLLIDKKEYIDNLGGAIGVDPVTGEGTGESGMNKIHMNAKAIADETKARTDADTALGVRIDGEAKARADADTALGVRIDGEAKARADADTALGGRIDAEAKARADADTAEMNARVAADDALGGRIDAEEMARMGADDALGGRIDAEEMARMAGDTAEMNARVAADDALGVRIDSEAMERADADVMLGGMIMAEEMARAAADMELGGRITSNAECHCRRTWLPSVQNRNSMMQRHAAT